jgi:hypothetical protein
MVFSGRIDNSNHPLGAGMEVDVLNLNGLLVTAAGCFGQICAPALNVGLTYGVVCHF